MIILTEERVLAAVSCITDQNGALKTNSQLSTSKNFKVSITCLVHQQKLRGLRTNPGMSCRGNLQSWACAPVMLQVWGSLPWVYLYLYLFCGQISLPQRLSVCSRSVHLTLKREECWEGTRGLWATGMCPDTEGQEVQDCCSLGWRSPEMW